MPRINEAKALADASYGMYQAERHEAPPVADGMIAGR